MTPEQAREKAGQILAEGHQLPVCPFCIEKVAAALLEAVAETAKSGNDLTAEWERQCKKARGYSLKFAQQLQAERQRGEKLAAAIRNAVRMNISCPECLTEVDDYETEHAVNCQLDKVLAAYEEGSDE